MRINYNNMIYSTPVVRCSIDELPCLLLPNLCYQLPWLSVPPLSAPLSRSVTPSKFPPPWACHFLLCSLSDQYTKAAAADGGKAALLAPVSIWAQSYLSLLVQAPPDLNLLGRGF